METIETRTLFEHGPIRVAGSLEPDYDSTPDDAECYDDRAKELWRSDAWSYVTVVATVYLDGTEIGSDSISGVEYGYLGDDDHGQAVNADPWEFLPPVRFKVDGMPAVQMPSNMAGTADEAISDAREWLQRQDVRRPEVREALTLAARWADPGAEPAGA